MTDRPMPVESDAATTDPEAGRYGAGRARRPVAMLLAIAINALVLLALMTLSPQLQPRKAEQRMPVSFTMADTPKPEGKVVSQQKAATAAPREARRAATPRPVEAAPPPQTPDLPFVVLSREVLASGDIGKMARGSGDKATGPADSAAAYGPGQGPGGERLYPVEWVREPTDAELSPFMPRGVMPGAWGLVACRTAENNRVENCQMLAESPVGSGMARAVRLASWQFLIRPPRIGGKPQIGVWMSVCIDLGKERGMCSRK